MKELLFFLKGDYVCREIWPELLDPEVALCLHVLRNFSVNCGSWGFFRVTNTHWGEGRGLLCQTFKAEIIRWAHCPQNVSDIIFAMRWEGCGVRIWGPFFFRSNLLDASPNKSLTKYRPLISWHVRTICRGPQNRRNLGIKRLMEFLLLENSVRVCSVIAD